MPDCSRMRQLKGLYASEGCPLAEGTENLPFVDDGDSGEKILQLFVVTL